MMREVRVLNFEGREIFGTIITRSIFSTYALIRYIIFLTSLDIGSLDLGLGMAYIARTRILLQDKQDSRLGDLISRIYIYFSPLFLPKNKIKTFNLMFVFHCISIFIFRFHFALVYNTF
jgi:hypothetical protein